MIVGPSGAGKTAFVASLAKRLFQKEVATKHRRPILLRFCGTSSESTTGIGLVRSLCYQLRLLYPTRRCFAAYQQEFPSEYVELVAVFHAALEMIPVVLIIDSLDQLVDENRARTQLSFLQHLQPHPNTIIIVSTLPDEHKVDKPNEWLYYYGCQSVLLHNNVKSLHVPLFESESKEAEAILQAMLSRKGHSLTPPQWTVVRALSVVQGVTPSALYLNMLVKKVVGWRSFDGLGPNQAHVLHLNPTVKGLVGQIFDEIEKRFVIQRHTISVSIVYFVPRLLLIGARCHTVAIYSLG
jgi:hypothetical protein